MNTNRMMLASALSWGMSGGGLLGYKPEIRSYPKKDKKLTKNQKYIQTRQRVREQSK